MINIVPVEPDACGALLKLFGPHQGGKGAGNVIQHPGLGLGLAFFGLQSLPIGFLVLGSLLGVFAAKDMWMAADHLGGDGLDHIAKIEQTGLGCHLGVEDGLEE